MTVDPLVDVRPPNPPWVDLQPSDRAGGFLSFFLRDELSGMAVRAVTLPGNNKSDPNVETGTYGLFSTCCQDMRAAAVTRRCRWLFFVTRQGGERVLAGYYRLRWYTRGPLQLSGRSTDYVLAADEVRLVHPPVPLGHLPIQVRGTVAKRFRTFKFVDGAVAAALVTTLRARPNATSTYINEIHRLERFNAYRTTYRYVSWKMRQSFGWDMAVPYVNAGAGQPGQIPTSPGATVAVDRWRCSQCHYQFVNKALLKRCPECGGMATLQRVSSA